MSFGLVELASFVIAICVLIAAHEYGHFWVARRLGFKVLKFSIGFGRALAGRTGADGVEYVIGAIPLGGYVKLADEREAPVDPADAPRAFNRRPAWQRILVLLAGPGANLLFAVLALWILYMTGVQGERAVLGEIKAGSIAAAAGLKAGDEIVAVGDEEVATREDAWLGMMSEFVDSGRIALRVRRGGALREATLVVPAERRRALTEPGAWASGVGFWFTPPHRPAVIGKLAPDGSAAAAGLKPGDEIVAIDGRAVADFDEFRSVISSRPGTTAFLDVRRGTADLRLAVAVRAVHDPAEPDKATVGRIGIAPGGEPRFPPEMLVTERYGPIDAIRPAFDATWSTASLTVKFLWRMLTGEVSLKNVSGPLSIASYTGSSAREGGGKFLDSLALISISLAILNLLPIPILDGGQIVYQCVEVVKGSPLSPRVQVLGQQVGIVLLILLMSLAIYNDLAQHFG